MQWSTSTKSAPTNAQPKNRIYRRPWQHRVGITPFLRCGGEQPHNLAGFSCEVYSLKLEYRAMAKAVLVALDSPIMSRFLGFRKNERDSKSGKWWGYFTSPLIVFACYLISFLVLRGNPTITRLATQSSGAYGVQSANSSPTFDSPASLGLSVVRMLFISMRKVPLTGSSVAEYCKLPD